MANAGPSVSDGAFRHLGRIWNRVVWLVILLILLAWDVSAVLTLSPVSSLYAFELGCLTGFAFSGLAFALNRESRASR